MLSDDLESLRRRLALRRAEASLTGSVTLRVGELAWLADGLAANVEAARQLERVTVPAGARAAIDAPIGNVVPLKRGAA